MKGMKSKPKWKSYLWIWAESNGFEKEMDLIEAAERIKRQMQRVVDGFAGDAYVDRDELMTAAETYAGVRDCDNCEHFEIMRKNCGEKLEGLIERAFSAADHLDEESRKIFAYNFRETRRKHD